MHHLYRKGPIVICSILVLPLAAVGEQKIPAGPSHLPSSVRKPGGDQEFALRLIDSAVKTAESCDPASRGLLLLMAGRAVSRLDPNRAKAYYARSFVAAQGLGEFELRLLLQQSVVSQMADLDLDQAESFMEQMDTPDITLHPNLDVRADLAPAIVTKLLARNARDDPDKAVILAKYLGDTGQYPYPAARAMIEFFHRQGDPWRAAEVLYQAVNYFRNDNQFASSAAQFDQLIWNAQGQVPKNILAGAIRTAAGLESRGANPSAEDETRPAPTQASEFEPREVTRDLEITRELLAISQVLDPPTAEKLKERLQKLQQAVARIAPKNSESASEALPPLGRESAASTEAEPKREPRPEDALAEVRELVAKEPLKAFGLAEDIQAPGYRSRALVVVADSLAKRDPEKAASILQQAEDSVQEIDPASAMTLFDMQEATGARVEALAELADAWNLLGNRDKASELVRQAFREVTEFLDKQGLSTSAAPSGLGSPVVWFGRLAQVEADFDREQVVMRAQSLPNPRLRAYVLLQVAIEILQGKG